MKNRKGFTLVEILAVIVLISLMLIIVVPSVQQIAYKSKVKLCNTKVELIENAVSLWAENNQKCFIKDDGCSILQNCTRDINSETTICKTTIESLAKNNIINYDKEINYKEYVINPINNGNMNESTLSIEYNNQNKLVLVTIDEDDEHIICSGNTMNPSILEEQEENMTTPQIEKVSVTFNYNDGTEPTKKEVEKGKTFTQPSAHIRTGYTLVEWQLEGQKYNFNDKVNKNITLNAIWEKAKYLVDINTRIDGISYEQGFEELKYDIYVKNSLYLSDVKNLYKEFEYGSEL